MQVVIQVGEEEFDDCTIQQAVIREVASRILNKVQPTIEKDAREVVMESIHDTLGRLVAEAFAQPVRRTNSYGEPKGDPMPFCELVVQEMRGYLQEPVRERDGKPTDGYSSDKKVARLEYWTRVVVQRDLEKTYHKAIGAAVAEVKAALDGKVTELVTAAVKSVLNL